nr:MAG TPA_asm: chromosome segregation protein [Caudoviricetes sp.]
MSINVKKYTKDQMAKMVEEAQEAAKKTNGFMNELRSRNSELELQVRTLKAKNAALTEQLDQMNGEAINKANEIANLKADADALRNKIDDTEAALGRANACIATMQVEKDQQTKELFEWQRSAQDLHDDLLNARERAHYAEAHPWRNLWAWVNRKLVRHD